MNDKDQGFELRILFAFALTFLVLFGWSAFMRSRMPAEPPAEITEAPAETAEAPAAKAEVVPPPAAESAPRPVAPGAIQGDAEQTVIVESDRATVRFSTRGALVRGWTLNEHFDAEGDPLELVHGDDTGLGFPLEIVLEDADLQRRLDGAVFVTSAGDAPELTVSAPGEVVFEWSDGDLYARKRIAFPNGYLTEFETEVLRNGEPLPHQVRWGGGFGDLHAGHAGFVPSFVLRKPDGLQRVSVTAATQTTGWIWKSPPQMQPPYLGPAAYAGIEDRYFAMLVIPDVPALHVSVDAGEWVPQEEHGAGATEPAEGEGSGQADEEEEKRPEPQQIGSLSVGAAAQAPGVNRFRLYVGPKDIDELHKVEIPAPGGGTIALHDEIVDFGWFWWVAKPLLVVMQWLYANGVGNYGWAIVLLTLVINTAMFPLKIKSSHAAWRMQKVQPQIKALQDKGKKYKASDPRKQELQQEMMAIYRKEGVNPMGGCLPLIIQFPFFFGFYRVLFSAIELRLAPWMLWVQDLSQPDPYYLMPIIMTGTMYLSTRMTPMTTADPAQQRMMRLMPLLFGVMFLNFPAGLVLYWFTSNLVGIAQQWWINKRHQEFLEAEKLDAKERKKQRQKERKSGDQER